MNRFLPCLYPCLYPCLCLGLCAAVPATCFAQPDSAPRGMVKAPEAVPLTPEELQKLTGGPTLVTYTGKDVPLAEVVKVFRTAAGQEGPAGGAGRGPQTATTISVDWKAVPFWEAAQQVEALTGLQWVQSMTGLQLVQSPLTEAGLDGLPVADTPFIKVYAGSIVHTATTSASLTAKKAAPLAPEETTAVNLAVYLDPKIKLDFGSLRVHDLRMPAGFVAPERGHTLDLGRFAPMQMKPIALTTTLRMDLPRGLKSGTVLPQVTGTIRGSISTETTKWEIEDILTAEDAQRVVGGTIYNLEKAEIVGGQLKLRVSIDKEVEAGAPPLLMGVPRPPALVAGPTRTVIIGGPAVAGGPATVPGRAGRIELPPLVPNIITMTGNANYIANPFSNLILRDSKGQRLLSGSTNSTTKPGAEGRTITTSDLTFNLQAPGQTAATGPFSITWELPGNSRNFDVPFELRDLKIP